MMISKGAAISNAAYAISYEGPPQFARECGRAFGSSPAKDVREKWENPERGIA
jgi:hypothetical protein